MDLVTLPFVQAEFRAEHMRGHAPRASDFPPDPPPAPPGARLPRPVGRRVLPAGLYAERGVAA